MCKFASKIRNLSQENFTGKQNKRDVKTGEMTFWEHLEELRWHFVRSLIAIIALMTLAFLNREFIFDQIILAPKEPEFITYRLLCRLGDLLSMPSLCIGNIHLKIININLSGQFLTHMYISFFVGLIAAAPYVIWEIWRFIKPALQPNEKKYARGAVGVISLLFLLGVVSGYYLIVPFTVNFFASYQVSISVENQITLSSYINTVVSLAFSMGVVFELPVFVYFLSRVGLLTSSFLKRNRKYMIIVILVIAAIITPPDVVSQILVSIPMFILYEISIFVSKKAAMVKK